MKPWFRMKHLAVGAAILLFEITPAMTAIGHGALDDTIGKLTRELAERPFDANLLVERAELQRVHGDFAAAANDLERAAELAPELSELDYYRGRLLLDRERFGPAAEAFARFVQREPDHVAAHSLQAEALLRSGRRLEAADAYARALQIRPNSGLYLAHARALAGAGESRAALASLDQAAEKLGPIPSLGRFAIELELAAQRFDKALERLDRLHAGVARKDTWLVRRGEILERAGRTQEARASYGKALVAVGKLSTARRRTAATRSLESLARNGVARLSTGAP